MSYVPSYGVCAGLFNEETAEEKATCEAAEAAATDKNKGKTFSQDDVNRFLADEKRKFQKQIETLQKSVNDAKAKGDATATMEQELEALRGTLQTKEEQAEHERLKILNESKTKEETLSKERDTWKSMYTNSTIERELLDAAVAHKAHTPRQIVSLLRSNTELQDEIVEGKKTGRLVPMTKLTVTDKDGKLKELTLSPKDAVKRFAEQEENFNLFTTDATGGTGGRQNRPGKNESLTEIAKDPKRYRELRAKGQLPFQQR